MQLAQPLLLELDKSYLAIIHVKFQSLASNNLSSMSLSFSLLIHWHTTFLILHLPPKKRLFPLSHQKMLPSRTTYDPWLPYFSITIFSPQTTIMKHPRTPSLSTRAIISRLPLSTGPHASGIPAFWPTGTRQGLNMSPQLAPPRSVLSPRAWGGGVRQRGANSGGYRDSSGLPRERRQRKSPGLESHNTGGDRELAVSSAFGVLGDRGQRAWRESDVKQPSELGKSHL